jgi:hypothetical protein
MSRKSKIEREVSAVLRAVDQSGATLYYPGGSGGGGRRRGHGTSGAVVLPHARSNPRCRLCTRYHTTAEHGGHADGRESRRSAPKRLKRVSKVSKVSKARKGRAKTSERAPRRPEATSSDPVQIVQSALRDMPASGRFGPDKVFISDLWDRIGRRLSMSLDQFKRWLVTQNRLRTLDLARADLVGAMDPGKVERSEIRHLGADFHFVIDRIAEEREFGRRGAP